MRRWDFRNFWKQTFGKNEILLLFPLALGICSALLFTHKIASYLSPQLIALAETKLSNELNVIAAQVYNEQAAENALSYSDLVTLSVVEDGELTTLSVNTKALNQIQTGLISVLTERVAILKHQKLEIPLGMLTGADILSGVGPKIPVRVNAVASVSGTYRNEFTDAGINQTHHRIMLDMTVRVRLVFAGQVVETEFLIPICVTEGIIIGKVPQTYFNRNE